MTALRQILARWRRLRQADNRGDDKRQACAQLAELLDLAWARLLSNSEDWRNRTASGDTITLLDRCASDVTAWCATNSLLFQDQEPAMLEHIRRYSSLLQAVVRLLRELPRAEHTAGLVARLNVCTMKLELELRAIKRYLGEFGS
jgi:hypothetical protein